jgi:lysozyme
MKITKISKKGLDLITEFEGFYPKPYLCPANVPTIGFGTTRYPNGEKIKLTDTEITRSQALEYLAHDLIQFEKAVDALCIDTINQFQFDALVSFAYNLGATNLKNSTLLKKVNANHNDPTISLEFVKWNRANGKILNGLTRRRRAEAQLYFSTILS